MGLKAFLLLAILFGFPLREAWGKRAQIQAQLRWWDAQDTVVPLAWRTAVTWAWKKAPRANQLPEPLLTLWIEYPADFALSFAPHPALPSTDGTGPFGNRAGFRTLKVEPQEPMLTLQGQRDLGSLGSESGSLEITLTTKHPKLLIHPSCRKQGISVHLDLEELESEPFLYAAFVCRRLGKKTEVLFKTSREIELGAATEETSSRGQGWRVLARSGQRKRGLHQRMVELAVNSEPVPALTPQVEAGAPEAPTVTATVTTRAPEVKRPARKEVMTSSRLVVPRRGGPELSFSLSALPLYLSYDQVSKRHFYEGANLRAEVGVRAEIEDELPALGVNLFTTADPILVRLGSGDRAGYFGGEIYGERPVIGQQTRWLALAGIQGMGVSATSVEGSTPFCFGPELGVAVEGELFHSLGRRPYRIWVKAGIGGSSPGAISFQRNTLSLGVDLNLSRGGSSSSSDLLFRLDRLSLLGLSSAQNARLTAIGLGFLQRF